MVVLESTNLSEIEFTEYCREKGIYHEKSIDADTGEVTKTTHR